MPVKGKQVVVKIPSIRIEHATINIVGTSPLISHKFSEKARKEMLDKSMQKAKTGREVKNPIMEFMQSLHWITPMPTEYTEEAFEEAVAHGAKWGFPAIGIKQSAVSGAYRAGLSKDKVSVYGAFHVLGGELIEIKGVPQLREDYAIVRNGTPDIRYRAIFNDWSMSFPVAYNSAIISLEQIVNYFNFGGFSVGIGDWRVEKAGEYGAYRVV